MGDLVKAAASADSLTVYRNILSDETVSRFLRLLNAAQGGDAAFFSSAYGAFYKSLSDRCDTLDFAEHLRRLVFFDDNTFSRAASRGLTGQSYDLLKTAAIFDLKALGSIAAVDSSRVKSGELWRGNALQELIERLPDFSCSSGFFQQDAVLAVSELETFYHEKGYGVFAEYGAFRWQGSLTGVPHPDPVRLTSLKEYEYERSQVAANTLDFVESRGGGNLLLYGDRGTGKSSTIKALANEYRDQKLRIVELTKEYIHDLPVVLEQLRDVPMRFILFLDDLSFSAEDAAFSALKSVLEGGVTARPENCLVYATSNRRHLIRESFSERNQDDVHGGETLQEKLSLYDRFDRTVNFFAPDQARYLAIVIAIAKERGLHAEKGELERGAIQWAINAGGRSPRTGKQFVDWADARIKTGKPIIE